MRLPAIPLHSEGVTLLELLIVVGIIAILSGMAFSGIQRSKQAAATAACLSNLRQIGLALQLYVNESGGRMPTLQNRGSLTNTVASIDTALFPTTSKVFQCPSDRQKIYALTGTSYFWNYTINGQDIDRLASIVGGTDPSQIPIVTDKEGFHPDVKDRVNILYGDGRASKELKFFTSIPATP